MQTVTKKLFDERIKPQHQKSLQEKHSSTKYKLLAED